MDLDNQNSTNQLAIQLVIQYGAPFVSKLCILLIGRFSTKTNQIFLATKYRVDFCSYKRLQNIGLIFGNKTDIEPIFLQVAKYRLDFFGNKIFSRTFAQVAKYPVQCHFKQHSTRFAGLVTPSVAEREMPLKFIIIYPFNSYIANQPAAKLDNRQTGFCQCKIVAATCQKVNWQGGYACYHALK